MVTVRAGAPSAGRSKPPCSGPVPSHLVEPRRTFGRNHDPRSGQASKSEAASRQQRSRPVYTGRDSRTSKRDATLQLDILPRVGAGEPDAVQECLDRYGGLVWSLARRHSPSPADAEDAVQEIFLSLWKNAAKFDSSKASEAGFITMIARRRLIDLFRGRQRRPQTQTLDTEYETLADKKPLAAEERTDAGLAARAMQQLDPKERKVVLLSTYHGFSHSEIAELTEMPLGTVKTYIRRGLMRVREALQKGEPKLEGVTS